MNALTKLPQLALPEPQSPPTRDVVIWDGKCNFCRSQVERLRKLDSDKLAYLSLHDPRTQQICPNLDQQALLEQMWVISTNGMQYGGADAGRYLSRKLPKLWWLMPIMHIPFTMPLWRYIYRVIANRRYRLAGKDCDEDGTCHLHRK